MLNFLTKFLRLNSRSTVSMLIFGYRFCFLGPRQLVRAKSKYSINFIDEIHRHTFENLGNSVEALNIDNNRLGALREEVFLPLTNLKSLQVNTNMNFRFQSTYTTIIKINLFLVGSKLFCKDDLSLMVCSSHIFVFWFLVFWSRYLRDFLSGFFRLAHLALQTINKDYVIFSYFRNFFTKSNQKPKTKNGMNEVFFFHVSM